MAAPHADMAYLAHSPRTNVDEFGPSMLPEMFALLHALEAGKKVAQG